MKWKLQMTECVPAYDFRLGWSWVLSSETLRICIYGDKTYARKDGAKRAALRIYKRFCQYGDTIEEATFYKGVK